MQRTDDFVRLLRQVQQKFEKCDNNGDDGSAKDTPTFTGKRLQEKQPDYKLRERKLSDVQSNWNVLESAKFKSRRKFGDKCIHKHTAKSVDEKKHSATFEIHITASDERQMQLQKVESNDKTQFQVRLDHLPNRYGLKREKMEPTLRVIQTGSEN